MTTLDIGVTIPDTVLELLTLAGDRQPNAILEVRTRRHPVGHADLGLERPPTPGTTTTHYIDVPITRRGKADRFWLYLEGVVTGTNGRFAKNEKFIVEAGEIVSFQPLRISWT
jgi:hypothetical protein